MLLFSESSKVWIWADGTYLNWWMKYQVFAPLLLLQFLNLFWYFLIMRIAYRWVHRVEYRPSTNLSFRAMTSNEVSDERSDDEDDGEAEDDEVDTVVSRSKKDD